MRIAHLPGSYTRALTVAQTLLSEGRYPYNIIDAIEADIEVTLPQTKLFQSVGPLYKDLKDLLLAHSVFWKEGTPMYSNGTSYLAAMLLVSMPVQDAFLSLVNLINKSLLKTFYTGSNDEVREHTILGFGPC